MGMGHGRVKDEDKSDLTFLKPKVSCPSGNRRSRWGEAPTQPPWTLVLLGFNVEMPQAYRSERMVSLKLHGPFYPHLCSPPSGQQDLPLAPCKFLGFTFPPLWVGYRIRISICAWS